MKTNYLGRQHLVDNTTQVCTCMLLHCVVHWSAGTFWGLSMRKCSSYMIETYFDAKAAVILDQEWVSDDRRHHLVHGSLLVLAEAIHCHQFDCRDEIGRFVVGQVHGPEMKEIEEVSEESSDVAKLKRNVHIIVLQDSQYYILKPHCE